MRKIIFIIGAYFLYIESLFASSYQDDMLINSSKNGVGVQEGGTTFSENILPTIESYLTGALAILAVGVFIYMGFKLFTARGNEEDFKKAWLGLVYAAVGLAIVPLSYIVVRIVVGFNTK